jgi:hypothetical protein
LLRLCWASQSKCKHIERQQQGGDYSFHYRTSIPMGQFVVAQISILMG